jgi:hypothetical protein
MKLSREIRIASLKRQINDMKNIIREQRNQENHRMIRILTEDLKELEAQLKEAEKEDST